VHGRPKETVENVTAWNDPRDVASMTREQRDALKRELLSQHPESQSGSACAPSGKPEGRATACAATATGKPPVPPRRAQAARDPSSVGALKRELLRQHPELAEHYGLRAVK
jgi:hypothetical protein